MTPPLLTKIAKELTTKCHDAKHVDKRKTCFFAEDTLPSAEIDVTVNEVGHITFPLEKGTIEKLQGIASKSRFGFRDQTISDETFRNSYEISKEKLHVKVDDPSLTRILQKMSKSMGLTSDAALTAHLYNMLIYPPGHFFKMHQDTEKIPNMVGTLVIVLPSPHIGGNLVIHLKEKHVFVTENIDATDAKCIGFYADCFHEVEEVKHGYRVALTYNLVLESSIVETVPKVNKNLKLAIKKYFDKYRNDPQALLTIVLDHSYTESGLKWNLLKGSDRCNALVLQAVAKELNLLLYLSIVEINEKRCVEWDDELENNVSLKHWVDLSNNKLSFKETEIIFKNEVCMRKNNKKFKPYKTEYSGYTGNEGISKDYWYKRAGIVLYPKSNEIEMNFWLDTDNALTTLRQSSRNPDNKSEVFKTIKTARYYLTKIGSQGKKEDFDLFVEVAVNLNEEEEAFTLLREFKWPVLKSDVVDSLVLLQNQYSSTFCVKLLERWEECSVSTSDLALDKVYPFVETLLDKGGDVEIAHTVLCGHSKAIEARKDENTWFERGIRGLKNGMPERFEKLEDILKTCAKINNTGVLQRMLNHVKQNPKQYPTLELAEMFIKHCKELNADERGKYVGLKTYLFETIGSEFMSGEKSDWSIEVTDQLKLRCTCANCMILYEFLQSKTEQKKVWPIPEKIRSHIINQLAGMGMPLSHEVLRSGLPHKLVLTKKQEVCKMAQKRFKNIQATYKALQRL